VPKIALVGLLIRICIELLFNFTFFLNFVYICGIISIFYGTVLSLYQTKIKRLLAYSAISHMGFIVSSLSLCTVSGFRAGIIYLLIYVLISVNIFAIILCYRRIVSFVEIKHLIEFSSMLKSNFFLAIIFSFVLLSLAGIPPLSGFFGKFYIFSAFVESSCYYTAIYLVLMSILGSIYYIRLIRFIFFNDFENLEPILTTQVLKIHAVIIVFVFIINLFFFLFQDILILYFDDLFAKYIDNVLNGEKQFYIPAYVYEMDRLCKH